MKGKTKCQECGTIFPSCKSRKDIPSRCKNCCEYIDNLNEERIIL